MCLHKFDLSLSLEGKMAPRAVSPCPRAQCSPGHSTIVQTVWKMSSYAHHAEESVQGAMERTG